MKYAWNITNISDLRAKANHQSERLSQLLFSEIIEIIGYKNDFVKVRQLGGYEGWVYSSYIKKLTIKEAKIFLKFRKYIVTSKYSKIYDKKGEGIHPYSIYYGTAIAIRSERARRACVILPDESAIYIKGGRFRPIDYNNGQMITGNRLVKEAKKFLGVPYLWGGVSPLGYDCSGLVQAVFRSLGIILPRDTKDQIYAGKPVQNNCIKTGDLLFFERHVGLAIGRDKLIHASRKSGGVRIESLTKDEDNFREDLVNTFVKARRII